MHKVLYTNASQYVSNRDGVFYYIRRVPHDMSSVLRKNSIILRIDFDLIERPPTNLK